MMSSKADQLHSAVRGNNRNAIEKLVREGASVDSVYYGMTPLLVAVEAGHSDMAVWLIEHGADLNIRDVSGTSVFEEAVNKDQVQVVKHLINKGADVNAILRSGHTALSLAAERKHTYLAQTLIEGGADVNQVNARGETPVFICAREGHSGVLELLIKAGVNTDMACGGDEITPLMAAVMNDRLRSVKLLIQSGCELNSRDRGGWTALWHAVSDSSEPMVRSLVSAGADIFITDDQGKTVMEEATENEMDDVIIILKNAQR